jgi:hypothetical protein
LAGVALTLKSINKINGVVNYGAIDFQARQLKRVVVEFSKSTTLSALIFIFDFL